MPASSALIIGYGEIGKAIAELEADAGHKVYIIDPMHGKDAPQGEYDVVYVNFPYSDNFNEQVSDYLIKYPAPLVIVNSTVKVGTCSTIRKPKHLVHSPVMGRHPYLKKSIATFTKFVGGSDDACKAAIEHFKSIKVKAKQLGSYETTELAKLASTSYYGWCISYAERINRLCKEEGLEYDKVFLEWNKAYNEGYTKIGLGKYSRPLLVPPEPTGLGGHCVTNNAILLRNEKAYINPISDEVMRLGFKTDKKYDDKTWLMCEYIGKKKSSTQIADECGVSDVTIQKWMKNHGIIPRQRPWTDEEDDTLRELALEMDFVNIAVSGLINRSYEAIRIRASTLNIPSLYNPAIRSYFTRRNISCKLRGLLINNFQDFSSSTEHIIRKSKQYIDWRISVFERDGYLCQNKDCPLCNNMKGVTLNAHHIKPFSKYPKERFNVDNGITYCRDYHMCLHGLRHCVAPNARLIGEHSISREILRLEKRKCQT